MMAEDKRLTKKQRDALVEKVWQDYEYAKQAKGKLHEKWAKYEDYYKNDQWKHKKVDPDRVKPTTNYSLQRSRVSCLC